MMRPTAKDRDQSGMAGRRAVHHLAFRHTFSTDRKHQSTPCSGVRTPSNQHGMARRRIRSFLCGNNGGASAVVVVVLYFLKLASSLVGGWVEIDLYRRATSTKALVTVGQRRLRHRRSPLICGDANRRRSAPFNKKKRQTSWLLGCFLHGNRRNSTPLRSSNRCCWWWFFHLVKAATKQ